jgi:hypothetical protein
MNLRNLTEEEMSDFIKALKKAYVESIKEGNATTAVTFRYELMYWATYEALHPEADQRQTQETNAPIHGKAPGVFN